jgi:hypothetical protein
MGPMTGRRTLTWVAAGIVSAVSVATINADTLVMRNGDEIRGELISVRDRTVEFEDRGGYRPRILRVDRSEVRRIEFERPRDDRPDYRPGPPEPTRDEGRPNGLRERVIDVSAHEPWTDTGVFVRPGQTVYFEATGHVKWGPDRRDGPEGEHNSPFNRGRPIPSRPAAALIGRVGNDAPFFIGADTGPVQIRGGGPLFLGVNDDYLQDNSGSFRVIVRY